MRSKPNQVLLTFDVEGLPPREDFFNNFSLFCLRRVLNLLKEVGFKGVFFITASAAERIRKYPDLVEQLSCHEIGYHSSSHSVRPWIIEYTDLSSYNEAVAISLKRETSHINPETGQIDFGTLVMVNGKNIRRPDLQLRDNDVVMITVPFGGG